MEVEGTRLLPTVWDLWLSTGMARLSGGAVLLMALLPHPLWGHTAGDQDFFGLWSFRWDFLLIASFLAATYFVGWKRLRVRNVRIAPGWRLSLYLTALVSLAAALISPIDALAERYLSAHMVQHLLLLMIAPPLFLLANPLAASLWGLPKRLRGRVARLLVRSSLFRQCLAWLTFLPVAWLVYVINLWVWHHPTLYQAALRNSWIHDLQHLMFFLSAMVFWWPVANPAPRLHTSVSYGLRIAYLIAATLQNTLLGMAVALPERVLYPFYATLPALEKLAPLNDQALGGGIMWVSGHMYLIPILFLVGRIMAREGGT